MLFRFDFFTAKFIWGFLWLLVTTVCHTKAQTTDPMVHVTQVNVTTEKANTLLDDIYKMAQKLKESNHIHTIQEKVKIIQQKAMQAHTLAGMAEKNADMAEELFYTQNCPLAAAEADDIEDYCRHLGYHTFEIHIYASKAIKQTDIMALKSYLYKIINYAEQSYETIKNIRIEIDECLKDAESCH